MDKIRSILQANSSKKVGPPVPPRPSPAAVAQALYKSRHGSPINQPPNLQQQSDGRTVILYKSPSFSSPPKKQKEEIEVNQRNHQFEKSVNDSSASKFEKVVSNKFDLNGNGHSTVYNFGENGCAKDELNGNVKFADSTNHTNGIKSAHIIENPMNNYIDNVICSNAERITTTKNLDSTNNNILKSNDSENNLEANPVSSESNKNSSKTEMIVLKSDASSVIVNGVKPVTLPRKSPVALPRSKTPVLSQTPSPALQNPPTVPRQSPPKLTQSPPRTSLKCPAPQPPPHIVTFNGNAGLNQKSVKSMNEFIKNNIYYGDENGLDVITDRQELQENEHEIKVDKDKRQENGNNNHIENNDVEKKSEPASEFSNNNSYTELLTKSPMMNDIVIISKSEQPSSNSSTLSYSSASTMHDPDYQRSFEIENNRKNLQQTIDKKENEIGDIDFKEKLLNEIFIRSTDDGKLIETSNNYVKLNDISQRQMKRANSLDFLNERPEPEGASDSGKTKTVDDKILEKKVVFSEMLISELTEMRKTPDYTDRNRLSLKGLKSKYTRSSPDISPDGTNRSRIRNSDVIEVDDNGKKVYSSCYISLEDSGLEDEEKLDDCSSSGVGDSWDSCKDVEER